MRIHIVSNTKARNTYSRLFFVVVAIISAICGLLRTSAASEPQKIPVRKQAVFVQKIFEYDRTLQQGSGPVKLCIVYDPDNSASVSGKTELMDEIKTVGALYTIAKRAVTVTAVAASDVAAQMAGLDIAFLCVLNADQVTAAGAAAVLKHVGTFGSQPDDATRGACASIAITDGKPKISINLTSAKNSGRDFSSELLKLATIVK